MYQDFNQQGSFNNLIENNIFSFFLRFFKFIFRERGREGEREGEKHQCVVASRAPGTGDLACNPGMCPDWELNWRPPSLQPTLNPLSYTSQGENKIFKIMLLFVKCYTLVPLKLGGKLNVSPINIPILFIKPLIF